MPEEKRDDTQEKPPPVVVQVEALETKSEEPLQQEGSK